MSFKEIYNHVKKEYVFEYEIVEDKNSPSIKTIRNYQETMIFLSRIRNYEFIKDLVDELENKFSDIFNSRTKFLRVDMIHCKNFEVKMEIIKSRIQTLLILGEENIKEESDTDINIRIPNTGLEDIGDYLQKIDKAMSQILINDNINGKVEAKQFQNGSLLVTLAVGSYAAVRLIGLCLCSIQSIRKKYYEAEAAKTYVNAIKDKENNISELRSIFLKIIEEELNKGYEAEAKKIMKESGIDENNHDYSEKLKFALKTFNELLDKGIEFQPNSLVAEDVKNLFPDMNLVQKLLGDGKDKS